MPRTRSTPADNEPPESAVSTHASTDRETIRLPLVEETLKAHVVEREQGKVRIHKRVETDPVQAQVELHHDEVEIDRVPVNEIIPERRAPWYEGETLMIPVYEEVLVTETKLVLREVIRLHNRGRVEQVNLRGTVRREVVDIEQTGS
jgi:uncharacterized protein (TIGR02271 family)